MSAAETATQATPGTPQPVEILPRKPLTLLGSADAAACDGDTCSF